MGRICIDIESYDPNLKVQGPGFVRNDAFVVGVAIARRVKEKIESSYFPIRHAAEKNIPETCRNFLEGLDKQTEIIGANIHYDLEGLASDGIVFSNPKRDIQIAEFLIDDSAQSYSLNVLVKKYLEETKDIERLQSEASEILRHGQDVYQNMHNLPSSVVGPYARKDAELTLRIYERQLPLLETMGLMDAFLLECELIDYVQAVRWKGIRIDEERADEVYRNLKAECESYIGKLELLSNRPGFNIWSHKDIELAAEKLNLGFPRTEKDNSSFASSWLELQQEDFWKYLYRARLLDRSGSVFVKSKIIDLTHNGRLYYQLSQVRGEYGGTVSSRFASRNPNMQQIPSRNNIIAKKIRSIFLPEEGETWVSIDESQAEIRMTVHYASLMGLPIAEDVVQQYIKEPDTDYHQWVADLTGIDRRSAKTITFAILYGAGINKIADELGVDKVTAKQILSLYHSKLKFAKPLMNRCKQVAENRGYVKTILGRRRQFSLLHFTYKAINAVVQGSCADIHKLGIRDLYRAGYLCILPIHDELNFSIRNLDDIPRIKDIILNCKELKVPRCVSIKSGKDFGNIVPYDK